MCTLVCQYLYETCLLLWSIFTADNYKQVLKVAMNYALNKLQNIGIGFNDLTLLLSKQVIIGNYALRHGKGILFWMLFALIYFISPIDLIPDPIPIVGYMDDLYVIKMVIDKFRDEFNDFEACQQGNDWQIPCIHL
eukprot:713669_1